MGKFKLEIEELAEENFRKHFRSGAQSTIKKINKILLEIVETPYLGIGNPKQLKHEFSGLWSRRINQKDRLIYRVDEEMKIVFIISAMGHYN